MTAFTESLTVRILADSSQFQQELATVIQQVTAVSDRFRQVADSQSQMGRNAAGIDSSTRALQTLVRVLDQVLQRVNRLNNTSINLNVNPALNSLQTLSRAIAAVAAQLNSLTLPGGVPLPFRAGPETSGRVQRFASGGLVHGSPGLDRVPAMLTAGEFVIRQQAAQAVGIEELRRLNQSARPPGEPAESTTSVNHDYGGITVNVARPGDVNDVIRDLRFQGFHLRTRRG